MFSLIIGELNLLKNRSSLFQTRRIEHCVTTTTLKCLALFQSKSSLPARPAKKSRTQETRTFYKETDSSHFELFGEARVGFGYEI